MNNRNKLKCEIAALDKQLSHHQQSFKKHQRALCEGCDYQSIAWIAALLPAFMVGWRYARIEDRKQGIKRLLEWGFLKIIA